MGNYRTSALIAVVSTAVLLGAPAWAQNLAIVQTIDTDTPGMALLDGPTDVAVSPDGRNVYLSASGSDAVVVFARDIGSGTLSLSQVVRDGQNGVEGLQGAELVGIAPSGEYVFVGGFDDRMLTAFAREPGTGRLSFVNAVTIGAPVAMVIAPDGRHLYTHGKILGIDPETGALEIIGTAEGAGGFSAAISPDGQSVYFGQDDHVTAFHRDAATGGLTFMQDTYDPPNDGTWNAVAALSVSSDGRFLYFGQVDTLGAFPRNPRTGELEEPVVGGPLLDGHAPWILSIVLTRDPSTAFLGTDSGVLACAADSESGELSLVDVLPFPRGAWRMALAPDERHLYAVDSESGAVFVIETNYTPPPRVPVSPWPVLVLLLLAGVAVLPRSRDCRPHRAC